MTMLYSFLRKHLRQKIIVFFSTCKQVKFMYEAFHRLTEKSARMIKPIPLHGQIHQLKRIDIYQTFCRKQHGVLFATDVASRGLDFPDVDWVVQMDCPEDVNAYIHRAGRTARFKSGGNSLLVVLPSEESIIEQLSIRGIPISELKIRPNCLHSPEQELAALLARNSEFKESAQRSFLAYIKSETVVRTNIQDSSLHLVNAVSDDDEDVLTIKRRDIDISADEFKVNKVKDGKEKVTKPVTKAAVAKKMLKKKIVPNKKTNFDEDGEAILDRTKSKVSERGREYDRQTDSGINIEFAKETLRQEDAFDKEVHRQKNRERKREEKRKLKKQRKLASKEAEDEDAVDTGGDERPDPDEIYGKNSEGEENSEEYEYEEGSADSVGYVMPDPDNIYGKKAKSEDNNDDIIYRKKDDSDSEISEDEDKIHRPPKRKLITSKDIKESKKKQGLPSVSKNLRADEELALKLLRH